MRHRLVLALPVLAATIAGARRSAADDAPVTKTYEAKNFSIALPTKDWTIEDANTDDQTLGYVCVARREVGPSVNASAWVLVSPTGGTSLDDLLATVRDNQIRELQESDVQGPLFQDWAGAPGAKYMRITGKKGGSTRQSRYFAAIVKGMYCQLEIRAWNGAEDKIGAELDSVATGFRFLGGSGVKEPAGSGANPEGGPEAGGTSVKFDKLGCTWTLPKAPEAADKPHWAFRDAADLDPHRGPKDTGALASAALVDGANPVLEMTVIMEPEKPGTTARAVVSNDGNFAQIEKNFQGAAVPNIDEDVKIGNIHGASRSLSGKSKEGRPLFFRFYLANLHAVLYQIRVVANDGAETKYREALHAALRGLKWDNVVQGVRGPWASAFPSTTEPRPDWLEVNQETKIFASGVTGVKPAALARIKFEAQAENFKNTTYGCEGRRGDAYMFFSLWRADMKAFLQEIPPKPIESVIDNHEGNWKNAVEDPKTMTQTKGKANKVAEPFKNLKAFKYEFSGTGEGKPVFERGYVGKTGQWAYWVRFQYVGKDAESAFSNETKALVKSLTFD